MTAAPVMFDDTDLPATRAAALGTPERDLDRTIAHLLMTCIINTGHLDRHTAAAQAATTPDSLAHNLKHARNHVAVISEHQVKLRSAITQRVPAVGTATEQLDQAISSDGTRKSPADVDRGLSHDLSSALVASGHVDRHLAEAQATRDPASVAYNLLHAANHILELEHYHSELKAGLPGRLPGVARELGRLTAVIGLDGSQGVPMAPGWPARSAAAADYEVTRTRGCPEPS